jgi:hypothetical protein
MKAGANASDSERRADRKVEPVRGLGRLVREGKLSHGLNCAKKLVKGGSFSNVKPFNETLRVTNPVRQSRASGRKRVLRGER